MKIKPTYLLHIVFYILITLFVFIACYSLLPIPFYSRKSLFPFIAILALVFFILGGVLIYLTLKNKFKKDLKVFLLVTGISASSFLVGLLLHNFLYALGVYFNHISILKYSLEFLHITFFIIAVFVSPAGFLVGSIGSIIKLAGSKK